MANRLTSVNSVSLQFPEDVREKIAENLTDPATVEGAALSATYVAPPGKTSPGNAAPLGWVNVKDYGAVGDGTADDTAAIQAALNTGRNVYVPGGRYSITDTLTMSTEGQRLEGAGGGNFLNLADTVDHSRSTLRLAASSNCDMLQIVGSTSGVVIRDIQLYGNRLFQSAPSTGIHFLDAPDANNKTELPIVENVIVRDAYTDGVRIGDYVISAYLRNVQVYNSGRDGIRVDYTDSRIINCEVGHCVGDGIPIRQWTAKVTGCDIWGNATGITLYSGSKNCTIVGNAINGNKSNGVAVLTSGHAIVSNEMHDNSNGTANTYHNVFVGASDVTVVGNNFGTQGGLTTYSNVYLGSGVSNVEVVGNVHQNSSAALHVAGPGRSVVGLAPRQVTIQCVGTPLATSGTWTASSSSTDFFGGRVQNSSSPVVGDYIEWDARIDAGTYTVDVFTRDGSNCGIGTVKIDGADLTTFGAASTTFDTYAASGASTRRSFTGVVVNRPRTVRIRVEVTSKNASSSSYFLNLNALTFTRTA